MSITALGSIPGAGCVLSFERSTDRAIRFNALTAIIPSANADAMICGVLPVDSLLAEPQEIDGSLFPRTFSFVQENLWPDMNPLLDFLKVEANIEKKEVHGWESFNGTRMHFAAGVFRRTAYNDLIFLSAPFMPIAGIPAVHIVFNGWAGRTTCSMFNYWEGRAALWTRLNGGRKNNSSEGREQTQRICNRFSQLREFRGDWDLKADDAALNSVITDPKQPERRNDLVTLCRDIHEETGEYFDELSKSGQLVYKDLLAGHYFLANTSSFEAGKQWLSMDRESWFAKQTYGEESGSLPGSRGVPEMFFVGMRYVDRLESGKLNEWLRKERGRKLSQLEIEEAWWMLMLRGTAWAMSVQIMTGQDVAPSSWRNTTPAYFG